MNINIINLIYEFDETHYQNYKKCIIEINILIRKFNMISLTYSNVIDIHRYYFLKFNPFFYKYCLINL